MTCVFRKTLRGLTPVDEPANDALRGIKPNQDVIVEIKRHRNVKQHRLYWALCGFIADNTDRYENAATVSNMLKVAVGHCDVEHRKPSKADWGEINRLRSIAHRRDNSAPEEAAFLTSLAEKMSAGTTVYVPKSINFASMAQDDFRVFFDRVIELVARKILLVTEGDLRAELSLMIGEEPQ